MLSHSSNHRSRGFTLIELLVVISIIAILAGMLLPVIGMVKELANQQKCGKQQSQILAGMVAYSTAEGVAWPDPRAATGGKITVSGGTSVIPDTDREKYTAACFELIAATQNIPNPLFKCPSAASGGPDKALTASLRRADTTWGWGPVNKVSYGFDWASPADPPASRVILADRDLGNHKDDVMAVFGDSHVAKLKSLKPAAAVASAGNSITKGAIKNPDKQVLNPDAKGAWNEEDDNAMPTPDNIYSPVGDAQNEDECSTPGGGHAKRAFLK